MELLSNELISEIFRNFTGTELLQLRVCQWWESHVQSRIISVRTTYDAEDAIKRDDALSLIHGRGIDWCSVFKLSFEKYQSINNLARKKITDWRPLLVFLRLKRRFDICQHADSSFTLMIKPSIYDLQIDMYIGIVYPNLAIQMRKRQEKHLNQHRYLAYGVCESGNEECITSLNLTDEDLFMIESHFAVGNRLDLADRIIMDPNYDERLAGAIRSRNNNLINEILEYERDNVIIFHGALIAAMVSKQYDLLLDLLYLPTTNLESLVEYIEGDTPVDVVTTIIEEIDDDELLDNDEKESAKHTMLCVAYDTDNAPLIEALTKLGIEANCEKAEYDIRHGRFESATDVVLSQRLEFHGRDLDPRVYRYLDDNLRDILCQIFGTRRAIADYLHELGYQYTLGFIRPYYKYDIHVPALRLYIRCSNRNEIKEKEECPGTAFMHIYIYSDFTTPLDKYIMEFED